VRDGDGRPHAGVGPLVTLDRWRALVDQLGKDPRRRALADAELERTASAHVVWEPAGPEELAVELGRVFGGWPDRERSPVAVERSRTIARTLASDDPSPAALQRALSLSAPQTRRLVAGYRARMGSAQPEETTDHA
jgi:hypothetical protein